MAHNLLGVGDDRWLRESLRKDPLQELRECKEELARKNEILQRFGPTTHTAYRENNPPRYLHEPLDRPVSAQAHYGRQYSYVPQYAPVTRPVIEQKVYNERITPSQVPTGQPQHYSTSNPIKQENHDLRVKVNDLQMRIDRLLKGRDDIEAEGSATITMWDELLTQICDLYAITVNKEERLDATRTVISRMREIKNQAALQLHELELVKTESDRYKRDYQVAQDTVAKMADQISSGHANDSDKTEQMSELNKNLLEAAAEKDRLDAEVAYLKSRLDGANTAWESAKAETDETKAASDELNTKIAELEHELRIATSEADLFKGNMANLLSTPDMVIDATFESIRDHIKTSKEQYVNSSSTAILLEQKLAEVTSQLERQCELHTETLRRAKRLEDEKSTTSNRYTELEDNLAATSVLNSTLQNQRDRFTAFLQKLADALKLTNEDSTRDLELTTDLLLERAAQLGQLNTEELAEKSSGLYALRRQIKTLKDNLKSKELHIEMMRKKMNRLDEESNQRSALSVDRDDAILSLQKCQKKNERLRIELANERQIILELKAKMSDVGEVRASNMELIDQLTKAKAAIEKLTEIKEKQRAQIDELKTELKLCSHAATDDRDTLQTQLKSLTSDLQVSKLALDETIKREKALIEFREVMARMLGLDVSRLSVPDYEIITRLERLIQNHHAHNAGLHPGVPVASAMTDPNFRAGFMHTPVEVVDNEQHHPRPPQRPRRQRY